MGEGDLQLRRNDARDLSANAAAGGCRSRWKIVNKSIERLWHEAVMVEALGVVISAASPGRRHPPMQALSVSKFRWQ